MASIDSYTPTGTISRAMFNYDAVGEPNFRLGGTVLVSVSDAFSSTENPDVYTGFFVPEYVWTPQQIANIQDLLATISTFANIPFQWAGDFDTAPPGSDDTPNPADVGQAHLSDININWIFRPDEDYAGATATTDADLGYTGAALDIYLNWFWMSDQSLGLESESRQVLMHELGHALGLMHPHSSVNFNTGARSITADFAALRNVGFNQLGFPTTSGADMDKEYFTVMSYDDQPYPPYYEPVLAYTPMILDVIALQLAYGEGPGTSGPGDDFIEIPGTYGYRTFFDKGGTDTIDLSHFNGFDSAFLHMGVAIAGAPHLVGVMQHGSDVMGRSQFSMNWLYGEYENAIGSEFGDRITGNALNNIIDGGNGNDTLSGGAGNDTLIGGAGNDTIDGGTGNDILTGGTGNDKLTGGTGNDTYMVADAGDVAQETSTLAAEIDEVWSSVSFTLGANLERLTLTGSDNINATGNSLANVITGNSGNNVLDGGTGIDTVIFSGARANYATLSGGGTLIFTDNVGGDGSDSLLRIERAQFADGTNFYGTTAADKFTAGAPGESVYYGNGGNDTFTLSAGNNTIVAGSGNDKITTGAGNDTITSGAGNDTISAGAGTNLIDAGDGTNKITTLDGQDTITSGNGNDTITAGGGTNVISGGDGSNKVTTTAGDDTIATGAGNDTIAAGEGNNIVNAGGGTDKITTGGGQDVINGGAGNDTISSGAGNDRLAGGEGNDTLTGGTGADIFRFDTLPSASTNLDRITDFLVGTDKIELETAIFAALAEAAALPAAEFRGGAGVTMAADADDHLLYNSSNGALYYDPDGAGGSAAVQIARLSNNLALSGSDFMVT